MTETVIPVRSKPGIASLAQPLRRRSWRDSRRASASALWVLAVMVVGLATLGACGSSSEADRLAGQLQDDPIIAEDFGIPGFSPGSIGRSDEMGTIIVDRTYRGPDRPLQAILQDRVEVAGWSAIGVRCRNDGRGFTLNARRTLDEHVALLSMAVYDDGDGRKISIEVTSRLERRSDRGVEPDPIEQCE